MKNKKIFISAGEASGDIHGSNLIKKLSGKDPSIEIHGLGRSRMVDAGLRCIHDMSSRSVMWLHTLKKIPEFWQIFSDCKRFFDNEKPELVILIDYAGFNFYLAKAAKKRNIPVMYYISPQLWAHGPWRVKKLKKLVDKMVVIYPFEEAIFNRGNVPVAYVGHPLFDSLCTRQVDNEFVAELSRDGSDQVVSLLPGSRKQEIRRVLPILLETAGEIHKQTPSTRFILSCSNKRNLALIQTLRQDYLSANGQRPLPIEIVTEKVSEIIQASSLCISCSGTVTLEIAYYRVPMIICYRISPATYFFVKPFLSTPYVCLVNKLSERMIVPEKVMFLNDYKWLAARAIELLSNEEKRAECIGALEKVKSLIGHPGASEKAANEALGLMRR
ncbi:MAG: lipid-A-disaccharide synthase [Planctomycetes bacterium]|nr:lipid-A-disaccharide synthase [Planctomycetota bacterium]